MAFLKPDAKRVVKLKPMINRIQKKYWALNKARKAYETAEATLKTAVGPGHEFTNIFCRVNKIGGCVYNNSDGMYSRGVGHRQCILCGNDDFDF